MKFYIVDEENKYLMTEIGSGGMTAFVTHNREYADSWDRREGANAFLEGRLAEITSIGPYRVVQE